MISTLARIANRLVEGAAVLLLLAMLGSVFLGVIFRFLNAPLAWTDEMAQYLLVWTAFTGWIIAGTLHTDSFLAPNRLGWSHSKTHHLARPDVLRRIQHSINEVADLRGSL